MALTRIVLTVEVPDTVADTLERWVHEDGELLWMGRPVNVISYKTRPAGADDSASWLCRYCKEPDSATDPHTHPATATD